MGGGGLMQQKVKKEVERGEGGSSRIFCPSIKSVVHFYFYPPPSFLLFTF